MSTLTLAAPALASNGGTGVPDTANGGVVYGQAVRRIPARPVLRRFAVEDRRVLVRVYGDGIGAKRKGHTHQGQDILAAQGTPVVAPLAGTILYVDFQAAGAGYYVVEQAVDGRAFFFAHCQKGSFAVAPGVAVGVGQRL